MALRVIAWPMGYIIVAKNRQLIFFAADLAWTVINIGLTWLCVDRFGVSGVGMAFFGSYVFHGFLVYSIVHRLTGFRWSVANRKTGLVFITSIAVVFSGYHLMPPTWAGVFGAVAAALSALYSLHVLLTLVSTDRILQRIRGLLIRFRLPLIVNGRRNRQSRNDTTATMHDNRGMIVPS
jgi:PST family polysaccharide transporter